MSLQQWIREKTGVHRRWKAALTLSLKCQVIWILTNQNGNKNEEEEGTGPLKRWARVLLGKELCDWRVWGLWKTFRRPGTKLVPKPGIRGFQWVSVKQRKPSPSGLIGSPEDLSLVENTKSQSSTSQSVWHKITVELLSASSTFLS